MTSPRTSTALTTAAQCAHDYLASLPHRSVAPSEEALATLGQLRTPLPAAPSDPAEVIALLHRVGSPATVASSGGRFFGFVIGGSLPAALGAGWLALTWDQNAAFVATSPVAATLEVVVLQWLRDLLGLPDDAAGALVTGATMANLTGLAAARRAVLLREGWDVDADGLFGAPPVTVVVGDEVHVSLLKALGLLGFGRQRVVRVPVDGQGRMRSDRLPRLSGPTIVCLQAGNVNTGAFDPASEICDAVEGSSAGSGAWVHVDGAFGLWATAAPERAALVRGYSRADSWVVDAHKWLNVPYDSGIAFVRDGAALRGAMAATAAYAPGGGERDPSHYTPEFSRHARGVEIWAALRQLGRSGVADLIEGTCRKAARMAERLRSAGHEILNEVVINQVLVSFGSPERTQQVIAAIQREGTCWCGGTVWQGRTAMRISVSGWATTDDDIERSADAIIRLAAEGAPLG
jgi:glutamate/tyrosine decarboxylase-like PLP-dependent enzyme